jgi:hypothetical protein
MTDSIAFNLHPVKLSPVLKQICREQEDRIEDHELRITSLEK